MVCKNKYVNQLPKLSPMSRPPRSSLSRKAFCIVTYNIKFTWFFSIIVIYYKWPKGHWAEQHALLVHRKAGIYPANFFVLIYLQIYCKDFSCHFWRAEEPYWFLQLLRFNNQLLWLRTEQSYKNHHICIYSLIQQCWIKKSTAGRLQTFPGCRLNLYNGINKRQGR